MSIKRITLFIVTAVICGALYTSGSNTWKWTSDFNGLVVLVSVPDETRSFNPFSNDFYWVSQDMAVSIIKNMEYPYQRCSSVSALLGGCSQPRIEYTGRFVGMVEPETEVKIFEIIQFLIERGEPIDAYSSEGYTALQSAILGNSPKLVSLLLKSGANPYLPIKREGKFLGRNSLEFIELLSKQDTEGFSKLRESFYEQMSNTYEPFSSQ
ncbi:hypothetical protein [Aliikangiella sp. IMCC44632]